MIEGKLMTTTIGDARRRDPSKPKKVSNFRPDLEGMRAVAVLAVFADHLFGWPTGGFVGVDIFFVLSGFFITGLLLRERIETGTLSFGNFYIRRVRRIIPAALLVLVVTVASAYIVFPATRAKETLIDAIWAALFGANWRFEQVGTDYFQQGLPPSPLQHYWSLSIEEQFYFVWPVLLLGLFALTRKYHRRGRTTVRHGALAAFMFVIVAASFTWAVIESAQNPSSAYFSTFTRVWELGIGALIAILGPVIARIPAGSLRIALSYLGLVGVAASLFIINADTQFPGPGAALPVLSTALVIAAFHGAPVRGVPMLTNSVAAYFGKTSYALYLWHWPVIVILAAVLSDGPVYYVLAAALALILTYFSFTYFEDPIRRSKWLENEKIVHLGGDRSVRIGVDSWKVTGFVVVAALIGSLLTIQLYDRANRSGEQDETLVVTAFQDAQEHELAGLCTGANALINSAQCDPFIVNSDIRPSVDTFTKDTQGAFSCWRAKSGPLKPCTYGPTSADSVKVALIGDSHAASLMPGLSTQLFSKNWNLTTYLGDGCRWVLGIAGNCVGEVEKVHEEFLSGKFDVILTTASRRFGGLSTEGLTEKIAATWRPVTASGTRVVAIGDNPTVTDEVISCLTRFGADASDLSECGSSREDALQVEDPTAKAVPLVQDVQLVDQTDLFCLDNRCPAVIGNVIAYRDAGGHVTATYQKTLAPHLAERIAAAIA